MMTLKQQILNKINQKQIFDKYMGINVVLGKTYRSPLREGDKHPSFNVYLASNGQLYFKDFAGDRGDCFDFVMKLYNITFIEACKIISNDFLVVLDKKFSVERPKINFKPSFKIKEPAKEEEKVEILHKSFPLVNYEPSVSNEVFIFNDHITENFRYINDYYYDLGISNSTLYKYHVNFIEIYSIDKKTFFSTEKDFAIGYLRSKDQLKIYRPFADKFNKFKNNMKHGYDTIFGIDQINKHEKWDAIVICAGEKDTMFMDSLYGNPPYDQVDSLSILSHVKILFICLNSESANISNEIMLELMKKTDKIYLMYDFDATGAKYKNRILKQWPHIKLFNRYEGYMQEFYDSHGIKDTSELYEFINIHRQKHYTSDLMYYMLQLPDELFGLKFQYNFDYSNDINCVLLKNNINISFP